MPITQKTNKHVIFKKSWAANIAPAFFAALLIIFAASMLTISLAISIVALLIAIIYFIYSLLINRSAAIYTDDNGVWLYSGILPWAKGITGVKWRDLDEAVFYQGFFGWLFKSYTIRIGHRFTKKSEILISNVDHGDIASQRINEILQAKTSLK